jgi:hypothetical protein
MRSAIIGQCCIATCPSKFSNLVVVSTGIFESAPQQVDEMHSFIPWLY